MIVWAWFDFTVLLVYLQIPRRHRLPAWFRKHLLGSFFWGFLLLSKMEKRDSGILILSQLMVSVFISQRRHELSYMHVDRSMMIWLKRRYGGNGNTIQCWRLVSIILVLFVPEDDQVQVLAQRWRSIFFFFSFFFYLSVWFDFGSDLDTADEHVW